MKLVNLNESTTADWYVAITFWNYVGLRWLKSLGFKEHVLHVSSGSRWVVGRTWSLNVWVKLRQVKLKLFSYEVC